MTNTDTVEVSLRNEWTYDTVNSFEPVMFCDNSASTWFELCAQSWQWSWICSGHILAAVSWLLASRRLHRGEALTGVNTTTRNSLLRAFSFAALMSLAVALNCDVDLSVIGERGTAQCHPGCYSCSFTLANGCFLNGIVECLPNVECLVTVSTPESCNSGSMRNTTVDGSQASMLTVQTTGSGSIAWVKAVFNAPTNSGDFRFETSTKGSVYLTEFYAIDSGKVDIVINEDGTDDYPTWPELSSMFVYASTAKELNIILGEDTYFGFSVDSYIECPESGTCLWQSYGRRHDGYPCKNEVVDLFVFPSTTLQVICANNADSCDDVYVYCNEDDSCQMQYAADAWTCDGLCPARDWSCDLGSDASTCTLLPGTTSNPTSTYTPVVTTTTTAAPQLSTTTTTSKSTTSTTVAPTTTTLMSTTKATTTTTRSLISTTKAATTTLTTTPTRLTSSHMPTSNRHFNSTPAATERTSTSHPKPSDDAQSGIPLHYVAVGGVLCFAFVFCCIVPIVYLFAQRQLLKAQLNERETHVC